MRKSAVNLSIIFILSQLFLSMSIPVPIAAGEGPLEQSPLSYDSFQPAIDGDKVVYLNGSADPAGLARFSNVYLKTVGGGPPQKITTVKKAYAPAISGGKVVWEDLRNDSGGSGTANSDIFGYTLPAGPEGAVDTSPSSQLQPDTSGGRVVWADNRNGNWDIYLKDTDGLVYRITADPGSQTEPRIDGDLIVWTDGRNGTDDIYLYNIALATTTRITDNGANQNGPDISGRKIVWTDWRSTRNTYVYDLDSPVANGTAVDPSPYVQYSARISGNRVVWTDWRNEAENVGFPGYNSDIYAANLITSETIRITYNMWQQNSPDVSGNRIVWADWRSGAWNIYLYEFAAPTGTIAINNGAAYTNSTSATLNLTTNGGTEISLSTDTAAWTLWEPYPPSNSKGYTLASGDGTKTIYVKFRDAAGAESTPAISDSIGLDTVLPLDPAITTSTPAPGAWASDNTVNVNWAGASDGGGSGVDGYSVSWTRNSTASPDTTLDLQESAASTTSAPLADGIWYFNLRTKDNAGNWTSTIHEGPFRIDTSAPTNPASTTETGGAISGVWQNTVADPDFTWSGATDTTSGVKGYYYYWGASATGVPTTWTASPAFNPPAVPGPSTYYLRVKTEDNAGNQSGALTLFTLRYDGGAPTDPAITTSTPAPGVWANDNTININWSGASDGAGSGIDGYSVSWSQNTSEAPDQVLDLQETAVTTTSVPLADGTWWFNLRTRDNAGNWTSTRHAGPFPIETVNPTNPTTATETAGGALSGVWQNTNADPNFTWPSGADSSSGVKGYYYYWGMSSTGAPTTWTASAAYNPPAIGGSGTYYLRVKTEDNAGNQSGAATLFTFNYDDGLPANPATATETGGALSDSWQNSVPDPGFTWPSGTDGVSGVKGYYYYWGAGSTGTPTTWTTSPSFDPPAVLNPSINYLRVKTEDNAGNQSSASTLFIFKYDYNVPGNPTSTTETGGSFSDIWQNTNNNPSFTWSGASSGGGGAVDGYSYYWGPSADGTSTSYTTQTAFYPPPALNPSVNYLRVRTKDVAGNQADWTTLFTFKYDAEAPIDPAITTSTPAPGAWGSDNTINVNWAAATDGGGSGIDGYSVSWTRNSTGTPDATLDLQESTVATTSAPLADGVWYFNLRTEDNAGNWTSTVHEGPFRVDGSVPTNPASATETSGAVSGIWQNTIADPNFTWSGASDSTGSGVRGYYYYWGADTSGNPTTWTASPAYNPAAVGGSGTYYLRVKTEDYVGNQSAPATLFTFKYDIDPPTAPNLVTELGGATNNSWQNAVGAPNFAWSGATDTASGIKGYRYYWDTNPGGTPNTTTTSSTFSPGPMATGTYYLKIKSEDTAGNQSIDTTTFVFMYDGDKPIDPTLSSPSHPTPGAWSSDKTVDIALSGGSDVGSGRQGYSISWSPNTAEVPGTTVNLPLTPSFVTSLPLADGTWWFNLRTKDNAGNWTSTAHIGPFKIDTTGPTAGIMAINAGAANTNSTAVTLSLPASDAGSGPAQMSFSNDGSAWFAWEAYATSKIWNVPPGDGNKTVYVKFKDGVGYESAAVSDSIRLDTAAPSASISSPAISTNVSKTKIFGVSWAAADSGSGLASCDVQYKIGSGGAWTNWVSGIAAASADFAGKPGKTYYFRARAIDAVGNIGAWSSESKTIVPFDQNSKIAKRVGFAGTMSKASSGNFLGTLRYSSTAGEEIAYTATGSYFALITDKGKGRGKAAISVDGKYKKTIDTGAKSNMYRQVVYSVGFAAVGKHTVRVVNKGTPGRPRINLDGLAVGN